MTGMINGTFRFRPERAAPVVIAWLLATACSNGSSEGPPDGQSNWLDGAAGEVSGTRGGRRARLAGPLRHATQASTRHGLERFDVPDSGSVQDGGGGEAFVTGASCTDVQRGGAW